MPMRTSLATRRRAGKFSRGWKLILQEAVCRTTPLTTPLTDLATPPFLKIVWPDARVPRTRCGLRLVFTTRVATIAID